MCLTPGIKLVPPIVAFTIESAARGEFEFSFGREPLVGPVAVRSGVVIGDMQDGMVIPVLISEMGPSGWRQFAPGT